MNASDSLNTLVLKLISPTAHFENQKCSRAPNIFKLTILNIALIHDGESCIRINKCPPFNGEEVV